MTVDQIVNFLVTITVVEMMVAVGLGVTFADLARVARDWRLVVRGVIVNYVCVPVATAALLLLMEPHPMVAAGFLILAVCPGAPYGPPLTALAKGSTMVAVGLMALLAGSSAIIAPILLRCLFKFTATAATEISTLHIVAILLTTQLLPLCGGMAIRQWRPTTAHRLQRPANRVSKVLNLLLMGTVLLSQFRLLAEIRLGGIFAMVVLLMASLSAGWLLGHPGVATQKAMAITTSLRNVAVGLVIATNMFAGTAAITAIVAYGLVSLLGTLAFAIVLGAATRSSPKMIQLSQ
jgi:BASS family bile acid:Na+ symporter